MNTAPIMVDAIRRIATNVYYKYAPDAVKDSYAPNHWKEKVFYLLVLLGCTVGLLVLLVCMPGLFEKRYWLIQICGYSSYLTCLLLFFFPKIPFGVRASLASGVFYLIGASIILTIGPFLASREWLFTFSITASILLGWPGAITSILINIITWFLVGMLIQAGYWPNVLHLDNALFSWHQTAMDLFFVNISTTVLITLLFIRIDKSDLTAKKYSQLLLKEGQKLSEINKKLEDEIEDRKTVTRALQISEEKYRTILETIADAYFECDLRGNLTFFNRALREMLDYSAIEMLGMSYKDYTDPFNAEKLRQTFNQVYTSRKSSRPVDVEVISKGGNVIAASILVSLKTEKNDEVVGFQGLARDVTEQKAMQSRLQQAQKMEAIGTLAGGVAHDLNNILSGVVNYPELLLMDMSENNPMHKALQTIKSSGEKAVAIVQDLLTLARRGVKVKEPINLNTVIMNYLQSIEFENLQLFHPNVRLETNLEYGLKNISGSPVHLSKVVMNLVSNAAEAIVTGGKVIVSTQNRRVVEDSVGHGEIAAGDYIVFTIRDTGDGIAPDDLNKIFEPFYTKKVMGRSGTGLGMAVVWGTIQDHGGHIDVQSKVGKGTTITIYLPVSKETVAEKNSETSIDQLQGKGERILIVDDVETQRDVATAILQRLGYRVDSVSSGESAIEYLKTHPVDLIVLDMIMKPGIDGLETYQRIIVDHPGQKAIIASGFSETEQVRQAQRLGAGQYIRKPYSIEGLGSIIRKELDR